MKNELHVGRLKPWLTSWDNERFFCRWHGVCFRVRPTYSQVGSHFLCADYRSGENKDTSRHTHPELYQLDVKLSSTCFLTLTQSSLCSWWPAHTRLYLFFTPRCNVYLIYLCRSAVPVRQRSRKQASQSTSDRLSYRGQAECEQDVFCSCSHRRPPGPVIRSIVQHFSDSSWFRQPGDLLKWKHTMNSICLFHSSSSRTASALNRLFWFGILLPTSHLSQSPQVPAGLVMSIID